MDYMPHIHHVLLATIVAAAIASVSEVFVAANVNDAASCGNADEGCNWLSPPMRMILAAVGAIVWGIVAYMTYLRYKAKTIELPV